MRADQDTAVTANKVIHVLIADDEAPARAELRYIIESLAPEAIIHEATDGDEALRTVGREPIQVVFLDIHMPGLDGLSVAAAMMEGPDPPLIVFATAYDEHALQAFELAALDYVLKPFDERRLARTMERVRRALAERSMLAQKRTALRDYLTQARPQSKLTKLWGERENGHWVPVDYSDILWVVAESKKVYIQTTGGEKLIVHHTLKELEPRLAPYNLVRVHKGYIVNFDHVAEVAPWFSGTFVIRMDDQAHTKIPMSRRYAAEIKRRSGWRS